MSAAHAPRTVLVAVDPWLEDDPAFLPFDYGVHRVAAAVAGPSAEGDVHVVDVRADRVEGLSERILELAPDVVGLSAYVWSLPRLWEVARAVRARRPDAWVVLGGPCARPEMFSLAPYRDAPQLLDAVVTGPGEIAMRDVIRARHGAQTLESVGGLLVPDGDGFRKTLGRVEALPLNEAPSPFQHGLVRRGVTGHLHRFSGCPLACSFCQWGEMNASEVLSVDHLTRELEAYGLSGAPGAMVVDAGLNLHPTAFRNLVEAEHRVGFFREHSLRCELYPSAVKDEHLEFLSGIDATVGVGLQSYDQDVLSLMQRRAQVDEFESIVQRIGEVAGITVEMILGLPGDTPASFRASFERARNLGFRVRVYRCLVLPDALMTRGDPRFSMDFDPVTLEMRSCRGWTEGALAEEAGRLGDLARAEGGFDGYTWWHFRSPEERRGAQGHAPLDAVTRRAIERAIDEASRGTWSLGAAERQPERVRLHLETPQGRLGLIVESSGRGPSYRQVAGLAFSYSVEGDTRSIDAERASVLERVIEPLGRVVGIALRGDEGPSSRSP